MQIIDLRSDTVTKPSLAMLEAIVNAKTGDDVYGEDETVNILQGKCAKLTGKEAALFVTSGVMALSRTGMSEILLLGLTTSTGFPPDNNDPTRLKK